MIIVKLGGSIITDKSRYHTFRKTRTSTIIRELSRLEDDMVIVHGGGSFGHIMAKEYGLPGILDEKRRIGTAIVHKDMVDLNQMVTSLLIDHGISAVSIPPSSFIFKGKKDYSVFRAFLENGMTPVSFGDVFIEERGQVGIYSGDSIMLDLAEEFKPARALFITDVDGIYDKNPKLHEDARLLRSIEDKAVFEGTVADVTGGIAGKLDAIKKMRKFVKEIYILNGSDPARMREVGTSDFLGTMVK